MHSKIARPGFHVGERRACRTDRRRYEDTMKTQSTIRLWSLGAASYLALSAGTATDVFGQESLPPVVVQAPVVRRAAAPEARRTVRPPRTITQPQVSPPPVAREGLFVENPAATPEKPRGSPVIAR